MVRALHLHANFPYLMEIPNAALGYLKSTASQHLAVRNIYWYLPPDEIITPLTSLFSRFRERCIDIFEAPTVLTIYLSRFFFETPHVKGLTTIESLITSYAIREKMTRIGEDFKAFVDYSLENDDMADADMAGFTVNFYQWILNSYIWSALKRLNPNIRVVVGGLATLEDAQTFMEVQRNVDFAIWGEGEVPLGELAKRMEDVEALSEVPRLVYRKKGVLTCTKKVGDFRPEALPWADHTDYFERVDQYGLDISPAIPILGVRSCKWNKCKFCGVNRGDSYYERPVQEVVDEIEYQSQRHATHRFVFLDTDFGRKRDVDFRALLKGLLASVDRRKKPYHMWITISPTALSRDYVEMMSKIRMHIQIGFESLSDPLLHGMRKMHRVSENIQAFKFGRDYGVDISGSNVIRNLPQEREEDVIESIENLMYLRFFLPWYHLTPSELSLYKGTPYYNETLPDALKTRWVVNILYEEIERLNSIPPDQRWDFFGFRARTLEHHQLWDEFVQLLEQYQRADISYIWLEFRDGTSLIEETNSFSGNKTYLLTEQETVVLKCCDSVTPRSQLEKMTGMSVYELDEAVYQLESVHLLYVDHERERFISIVSVKALQQTEE
ncbi:MAG: radical SAM protein [Theionarchaea archaeon]|nr:radical SAM protein [Theionarchaea archaeon]MBU7000830.1 radical SAM protein [Theionarchaea archaeon]MBU7021629.1 radical SAM protein [Theionarchaea archaeon]MBU7034908.1 radical SAM protein [Theionarchaea archaeon]MBU7039384.1 radical SAM protein [Theionarchaea archaeon]